MKGNNYRVVVYLCGLSALKISFLFTLKIFLLPFPYHNLLFCPIIKFKLMERKKLFALLDALADNIDFTPNDLEIYIDCRLAKTPLPLFYFDPEKHRGIVARQIMPENRDYLVGVLINTTTVLHLKAFTKNDAKPLLNDPIITPNRKQVGDWVKKNFNQFLNPRPPRENECYLLENQAVRDTFEILQYNKIKVPNLCWERIGPLYTYQVSYKTGCDSTSFYLENYGDLFILSDLDEGSWKIKYFC